MALRIRIVIAAAVLLIAAIIVWRGHRPAIRPEIYDAPAGVRNSGPCISFQQAATHAGENGCITGYVLRAYTSKSGNTFLDFCPDYRSCPFSSVIFSSDRAKFGNLEALSGRRVEIRGFISTYQGKAEVVIHDPWQIQALQQ